MGRALSRYWLGNVYFSYWELHLLVTDSHLLGLAGSSDLERDIFLTFDSENPKDSVVGLGVLVKFGTRKLLRLQSLVLLSIGGSILPRIELGLHV